MRLRTLFFALIWCGLAAGCNPSSPAQEDKPLNVAVFGFVPDGDAVAKKVTDAFGKLNTGYTLQVTLLDPYHDTDQGMPSLQHFKEFDVVETDLCRFDDLQSSKFGGVDPLPSEWNWRPTPQDCVGPATIVMASDQNSFVIPHWICGNFLVFWSDNVPMTNAHSFDEIVAALNPPDKPLLSDMWGKTGLGEFYADALLDIYGPKKAADDLVKLADAPTPELDKQAETAVLKLADRLPAECRDHLAYFDTHFEAYGWAFASNKDAVYLGYSEGLFRNYLN